MESQQLYVWYEAVSILSLHESFAATFDQLQELVLDMKLGLDPSNTSTRTLEDMEYISSKISRLWNFVEVWDGSVAVFPDEIYTLASMIDSPKRTCGLGKQRTLLPSETSGPVTRQLYNMLDARTIGFGVDRLCLVTLSYSAGSP